MPARHSPGGPGPWSGHLPFACDLIASLRPTLVVELGTFYGESYFGFCQAAREHAVRCESFAVDTWEGDEHGGHYGEDIFADVQQYNRANYESSSRLMRMTFDGALGAFSDSTIGLLHIDGFHTYEAARHDFDCWFSKVRPGGVILLHDIGVRSPGFGVWRLWEELRNRFACFAFLHSAGLGVVAKPGAGERNEFLETLTSAGPAGQARISSYYTSLAERIRFRFLTGELLKAASEPGHIPVQIFTAPESRYTEQDSVTRVIEAGEWTRLYFELPCGIKSKQLRIDPADRPSIIEISDIRISPDNSAAPLWRWSGTQPPSQPQAAGTARILETTPLLTVLSDGVDPQLLLNVDGIDGVPVRVEIVLRVTLCVETRSRFIPVGIRNGQRDYLGRPELDRAFLRDEVRTKLDRLAPLAAAYDRMENRVHRIEEVLTQVSANEKTAHARLVDAAAEARRREDIERSWSWRVTAPARFLLGLTRRRRDV